MSQSKNHNKNLYGIIFMLCNALALSMLYVFVHFLKHDLISSQIVFLYKSAVLICILPWALGQGISELKTNKIKLHLARGFLSTVGALLFMHGMVKVNLANAIALNKMEPIILIIIGVLYFKEKLSTTKISATIFSFIGMLFVMYPVIKFENNGLVFPWLLENNEANKFDTNYLFVLAGVCLWAINNAVIKTLGKTEENRIQMFYISLISVLISFPAAMIEWDFINFQGLSIPHITNMLSFADLGLTSFHFKFIGLSALMHFIHLACHFLAYKLGEMSVVVPFDYSRLIFGGILSYYFFDTAPSFSALIGYAFIIISGVLLLQSEAKLRKALRNQIDDV